MKGTARASKWSKVTFQGCFQCHLNRVRASNYRNIERTRKWTRRDQTLLFLFIRMLISKDRGMERTKRRETKDRLHVIRHIENLRATRKSKEDRRA